MIPNRLTDLVAIGAGDPGLVTSLRDRLPRADGWHEVPAPAGWLVAMRGLGDGDVPERPPFVLEGWADLHRWRGDVHAGHATLRSQAERRAWSAVPGDVSYADLRAGGRAVLVRAPAARVPIYVHRHGEALLVATRMDLLLGLRPEWPWQIDALVAVCWTGAEGVLPPGRTSIRDVRLVPAGHALEIDAAAGTRGITSRYWDPRPQRSSRRFDERAHAQELREAILSYLDVELDREGHNLLSLSLGVDSSTLAAVTGRTLGRGYGAISFLPTNPTDRAAEDRKLASLQAVAPPSEHACHHVADEEWIARAATPIAAGVPVVHPVLMELAGAPRAHRWRTLFGGEWADAACGDRLTVPDWLAEAPVWRLVRDQGRLPVGERAVLDAIARRLLRRLPLDAQIPVPGPAPTAAHPDVCRELDAWEADLRAQARAERGPRLRLWYQLQLEFWIEQNWEVLSRLGVRRVTPFYQRRVVELAFAAPPHALIGPHVKKPLRRAFAAEVPHELLWREKGIWPNEPMPGADRWQRDLPAELASCVREDWFPRPPGVLPFEDRFALAGLEGYALSLRALRSELTAS